jgi:hypothetical protein
MITSFEVGAVFKILDEASPALARILKQVRELNLAVNKARESLALLSGSLSSAGVGTAVAETGALAKAWSDVAKNASSARLAIGSATSAARGGAVAGGGAGLVGGGRHRPGWLSGNAGGSHITGAGVPLPGGSHIRLGGPAIAGAAALGWGVDRAARTEDIAWQLTRHAGLEQNDVNHARFRKIIQEAQIRDGFDLKAVGEAALQDIRMMQGTPGGGLGALPEMLHIAAVEARSKNTGLGESMTATVGLAHMLKAYDEKSILQMAPMFAALSTADPRSLQSIERAAGYAVPTLQSIGADPSGILLLGTALARAGVLSTKSGTWTREALTRAMPGVVLGHSASNKLHEEALRKFGLVDEHGKPTWFTGGRPDALKMFKTTGENMEGMSPQDKVRYGRAAFGTQGFGAVSVLSDPKVQDQVRALDKLRSSPEFLESYRGFSGNYQAGSTMQDARTAMQEFNVVSGELARITLPALNIVLGNFRSILEGVRSALPGSNGKGGATIGARAIEGAGIGAAWGAFGGPLGIAGGAVAGGVAGGVEGVAEQYMKNIIEPRDRYGRETVITGNSAAQAAEGMKALGDAIRGLPAGRGSIFPGGTSSVPPITLNLNVDGSRLASAISQGGFPGQAPAADGMGAFNSGDHNTTDK